MILGLRTAIYHVDDLQAAKEWYTKVLGVEPYFDEPFYVGFNVGGYELGLNTRYIEGQEGQQQLRLLGSGGRASGIREIARTRSYAARRCAGCRRRDTCRNCAGCMGQCLRHHRESSFQDSEQ